MKKALIFIYVAFFGLVSCSENNDPFTVDPTQPTSTLSVMRSGNFIDQNASGPKGVAELGTDTRSKEFLQFSSDFNTALATGTVTVFLSTSKEFRPDPGNGNPNLLVLEPVRGAGENFFAIPTGKSTSKYTHVILWC